MALHISHLYHIHQLRHTGTLPATQNWYFNSAGKYIPMPIHKRLTPHP